MVDWFSFSETNMDATMVMLGTAKGFPGCNQMGPSLNFIPIQTTPFIAPTHQFTQKYRNKLTF